MAPSHDHHHSHGGHDHGPVNYNRAFIVGLVFRDDKAAVTQINQSLWLLIKSKK